MVIVVLINVRYAEVRLRNDQNLALVVSYNQMISILYGAHSNVKCYRNIC
jgi:hypothetical protein